jgi:DNA polymerase III sliding clamp (beta) subunit (PCNA family)
MSEVSEETTQAGVDMLSSLGIELNTDTDNASGEEYETIPLVQETVTVSNPPEFSVPRAVLVRMVEQCMLVVPTRDFVPALKSLVLDVTEDRLAITGSDSTSTVICHSTTVRVTHPGRVLIGATKFSNVIRLASGSEVSLRAQDQMLHISSPTPSSRSDWSLRIAGTQDYVSLADLGDLTWHTIDRANFVRAVGAVRYAASSDENDPGRMQLDISQGTVTTTDKTCFAQVTGQLPADLTCRVSTAAADLAIKMLERNDAEEFRLADTPYHTVVEIGSIESPDRMIVAHITEEFPAEAKNAIQTPLVENRDQLTVDADDLIEALRRASPTSDEETLAVALKPGVPEPNTITVATRNRYGDLSTEVLKADFVRLGSDKAPPARTVVLSHKRLTSAICSAGLARPGATDSDCGGAVRLMLGEDRTKSRPAFVLVRDGLEEGEPGAGTVQSVLSQVRSEWMT